MAALAPDLYSQWRARNMARPELRENLGLRPAERVLQSVWHHQRLRRDELSTVDGRPVRVLHPGFWNRAAGPDFRGAVLQFGGDPPRSGDVEIDLVPANWQAHQHHGNPAFAGVILHVLWTAATPGPAALPALALEKFLDSPLAELEAWSDTPAAARWPEALRGACCAPLRELAPEQAADLVRQAALLRLQRKARELEIRARHSGWEQALWEGTFRALGYQQNVWPMQRLGELLPRLREGAADALDFEARLFGVGGLLPADPPRPRARFDARLRALWDRWWRDRDKFADVALPRSLWRFGGLRPANHPHRRLALAAQWLAAGDFPDRLQKWFTASDESPAESLPACLRPPSDDYWPWRWSLAGERLTKPQPLLGAARATDLAVNVLLPWFLARAETGGNARLRRLAEKKYFDWPAAQDNAVLRLARQRLFGQPAPRWLKTAAAQQGLLQIARDFCQEADAVCSRCAFPDLVRNLPHPQIAGKEA